MRKRTQGSDMRRSLFTAIGVLAVGALLVPNSRVEAFEVYAGDQLQIQLDTTLTYGMTLRVSERDDDLIGTGNGGAGANPNWDDGDLNYNKGSLVSNQIRITSDLDIAGENLGGFFRGTAFYDFENSNGDRARTELGDGAKEEVARDAELLDAYLWGSADLGPFPAQLRIGEQVVNWGESTFILGGIGLNTLNPISVYKLRSPGAELREALKPEGMIWGNIGLTENLSAEALYAYDWEETELDEPGSYFSFIDFVGRDGQKLVAGNVPDNLDAPASETFLAIPRASSEEPSNQGQFGVALRYFASWLHDTELSFYYMRYHSKMPMLTARTGTVEGAQAGAAAAQTVYAAAGVNPGDSPEVDLAAQAVAFDAYLNTARYRTEFQEDIDLFGMGFNTEILGWGFQGELSHRLDVPLQIDDTEILFGVLSAIDPTGALGAFNQVGDFSGQFDAYVPGSVVRDITQIQLTFTKLFGAVLGAQDSVFVGEVGWHHVYNMPSKSDQRLELYGPYGTGNQALNNSTSPLLPDLESSNIFPDADSWGYVLLGKLEYNNVIGPIGFSPRLAWAHDVRGISPNGGPFIEGRKSVTAGLEGRYLEDWSADLSFTNYFGAGKLNQINDRDFVSFSVKYRF